MDWEHGRRKMEEVRPKMKNEAERRQMPVRSPETRNAQRRKAANRPKLTEKFWTERFFCHKFFCQLLQIVRSLRGFCLGRFHPCHPCNPWLNSLCSLRSLWQFPVLVATPQLCAHHASAVEFPAPPPHDFALYDFAFPP